MNADHHNPGLHTEGEMFKRKKKEKGLSGFLWKVVRERKLL